MVTAQASDSPAAVSAGDGSVADPASEHAKAYRAIAARVWEKIGGASARRSGPRIVVE